MKRRWIAAWVACLIAGAAGAWEPPTPVDVDKVLREAREATVAGQLDKAAVRHRWYHENALRHLPAHSGVRLSFALHDWYELARRHPPAMQDMLAAQQKAMQMTQQGGPDARDAFGDLTAFAEVLGDAQPVASTFAWLDANRPADARRLLLSALPALVTANEPALAVRYLDVDEWLRRNRGTFELLSQHSSPGERPVDRRRQAQEFVDRQAAFAVAAMVKAGRPAEAGDMVKQLRRTLGDDAKMASCDDALRGHAPPLRRY